MDCLTCFGSLEEEKKESVCSSWGRCNANKQRQVELQFPFAIWKTSSKLQSLLNIQKKKKKTELCDLKKFKSPTCEHSKSYRHKLQSYYHHISMSPREPVKWFLLENLKLLFCSTSQ